MSDVLFRHPPQPTLLQKLAKGLLEQNHHLTRAVRLWVWLRWLYGDKGYTVLPDCFTYADWRQAFFSETHQDEKREDVFSHQDPNCACTKTTRQWLYELDIPVDEWQQSLQKQIPISDSDLKDFLQERLFAQVRKSLQSDLDLLVTWGWLQQVPSQTGRSKHYRRVEVLPISHKLENLESEGSLTTKEQVYVAETLEMLGFLDPNIPLLAEQIFEQPHEDTRRVSLYIDYLVPESTQKQDDVDQIQGELQEIWNSGQIQPLLLTYHSAHLGLVKECVVYPVCIYYMERAKYLCAYGSTPNGEINWHNYRLDRICSKRLVSLDWEDPRVPQLLREKYEDGQLPTQKTVQTQLKQAWGFDFYKPSALMLLRFNQKFHDRYIRGTFLHHTFEPIDYQQADSLIKQHTQNPEHRQALLEILQSRSPADAYYQAQYRVTDYHVLRRLRALGPEVEVLLPWDLREKIALHIQQTWNHYK
ncbi:TIGR03985 family CRISPR-associated protein [Allocoleopsis franciscana]|uniref:CRISPR-associated protein, TIGR03985 family n=1 Tax=Allocoleopsis franciscana PCC 7113 TaxID=1173027 RepID=K9WFU9_9CYAN|nr:TIGR03985 family CRISPR-associated protein [Allocoleopsis franciscana]AFZ18412.1 CRISPR-associated protein, TIGR03985 family [Allocoleopsis franciscana PCC 7113]